MAIALTRLVIPEKVNLEGSTSGEAVAGEKIKVDIGSAKVLEDTVPVGKKWGVTVKVTVYESAL